MQSPTTIIDFPGHRATLSAHYWLVTLDDKSTINSISQLQHIFLIIHFVVFVYSVLFKFILMKKLYFSKPNKKYFWTWKRGKLICRVVLFLKNSFSNDQIHSNGEVLNGDVEQRDDFAGQNLHLVHRIVESGYFNHTFAFEKNNSVLVSFAWGRQGWKCSL